MLPGYKHRIRFLERITPPADPRAPLKNVLRILFVASVIGFIFLSFFRPPLPPKDSVLKEVVNFEPIQKALSQEEETIKMGNYDYKLKILYSYDIWGLVVSKYNANNWLDITHKQDPGNIEDVCVVWGKNIADGAYQKVTYKSGEYTCYYSWKGSAPEFYGTYLANNHLIPKDSKVTSLIRRAAIGDQVHIKGYLVDYSVLKNGQEIFTRRTSTTRNDTGNGACEIIYVTDFEILKGTNIIYQYAKDTAYYLAIISLLSSAALFFF